MLHSVTRNSKTRALLSRALIFVLVGSALFSATIQTAKAATVTSLSDVLSRIEGGTVAANHEIKFVTPTGVAAGQTIILTFSSDFGSVTNIVHTDIDFAEDSDSNCNNGGFSEKTLAASPSGATWGADGDSATTVTLTSGTGTVTAGRCVRILIGTNAVSQTTGTNQITNGATDDDDTVSISGTFGDTGTISIDIITDDTVNVTATVNSSITFTISDTTVGFGTLSVSTGRWATNDGSSSGGTNASNGIEPTPDAHTMTVATNATDGYAITYNGATLTSGSDTISGAAESGGNECAGDSDCAPGTEQFGISIDTNGDASIDADYARDASADFSFVAGTTTSIITETGPTATETFGVSYIANISGTTEPGSYSTNITYVATGIF